MVNDVTHPDNCPHCQAAAIVKNGKRQGRQAYLCKACQRQFLHEVDYCGSHQYSSDIKALCLKMHLQKRVKLREIERITDIHHTTILHWVREANTDSAAII